MFRGFVLWCGGYEKRACGGGYEGGVSCGSVEASRRSLLPDLVAFLVSFKKISPVSFSTSNRRLDSSPFSFRAEGD
jgi:hypothetical protein